ncbi:unnamed protein product [Urochloa humidicola]
MIMNHPMLRVRTNWWHGEGLNPALLCLVDERSTKPRIDFHGGNVHGEREERNKLHGLNDSISNSGRKPANLMNL